MEQARGLAGQREHGCKTDVHVTLADLRGQGQDDRGNSIHFLLPFIEEK